MFVSSANRKKINLSEIFGRSFIYRRNKRGPRTDPWGTPHVMFRISEETPL